MKCWSCERDNRDGAKFCATCGAGLGCPDCGATLASGQRFCTTCGRRAPIRGAQTVVRRIERRTTDTPHFRITSITGSFAEQNAALAGARLEQSYAAFVELLGGDAGQGRIDVRLADVIEDPAQPGAFLGGGGYPVIERREIHEVFSPESPGTSLDRSLLLLVLGSARAPLPLIGDGLQARALQRSGGFPPDDQVVAALAAARAQSELPPLAGLVGGPAPQSAQIYIPAAASFTGYLLAQHGPAALRRFAMEADPANVDVAARAAFGRPLVQIEKAWRKTLKGATPGGVGRFLKLSWRYLRPHRLKVAEITFYIALSVAFGIGLQKTQQLLVDKALPGFDAAGPRAGDSGTLAAIMAILVGAFVIVSATSLRESYLMAWVSERVVQDLRRRIFQRLQEMQPGFFQQIQTGDIMSRMTSDLAAVEFALTGALASGLRLVLTLVAAVITIFWLDWKLAALAMVFTPLFFIAGRFLGPSAARASFERQRNLADNTSLLQENLAAQPVVKAFGLQGRVVNDYVTSLNTLFRSSIRLTFLSGIFGLSANSIASAIQLMVLGLGGWFVIRGDLTIGTLFAFLGLMGQIIGPMQSISSILQAVQQASGAMDRVDELLQAQPTIADLPHASPLPPLSREIRFESVGFSYTGEQPNLQGLNLLIPAGRSVALVGPSGCGKSTTLNLLMRFYDPQAGRITFDGVDIRDGTLDSLRAQMGVVFQDNFLFNTTLRENIRYGRLDASDAEVEAAAKAAEIHDIILQLPEGYNTLVGERGGRLSGGQRQRVAIARAVLRNPAVLLLDEATSALDPRTEAAVNETLDRLSRGRTTIAVTHRLSSIVNVDQIFVFDRGALVEQGTHDELVKIDGLYARLWQEQGGYTIGVGVQYVGVEAARLQSIPLFAQLDGDILAALSQRLAVERYPAGDVIVNQGEIGDRLFIIHKGQVEVSAVELSGHQRSLAQLREGDHFGEVALLYDTPRTATIRALSPVQLYSLGRDDFSALMNAVPGLRQALEETMFSRHRTSAVQGSV